MLMKFFLTLLAGIVASSPVAQAPASVKLYIFDCGTLKSGNPDVLLARGRADATAYALRNGLA